MSKIKYISVLGCGWFGLPLAKELVKSGFAVKGSTTTSSKLDLLRREGVDPFLVQLNPQIVCDRLSQFIDTDLLIVNIPPKGNPENYAKQCDEVVKLQESGRVTHLIFISSTSVYPDSNRSFTEEDTPEPDSEVGKALAAAEAKIMKTSSNCIIRFAGLIGPGRNPGRFFAGKKAIPNGDAPVNLIHLTDCIGHVKQVIQSEAWGRVYNASCPDHPRKKQFYSIAAEKSGYALPEFIDELTSWKQIESVNIPKYLQYNFAIKDLLGWASAIDRADL